MIGPLIDLPVAVTVFPRHAPLLLQSWTDDASVLESLPE